MKPTIAMRLLTAIILGIASTLSSAEKKLIYKSVDDNGTTIFTDQAAPDAAIIDPAPLNVMQARPTAAPDPQPETTTEEVAVDSVTIHSPTDQQMFIAPQTELPVEFELAPNNILPAGWSAQLLMNGVITSTSQSNDLSIPVPVRGTHTVQIQLLDQNNDIQVESNVVKFHVRQHIATGRN